MSELEKGAYCLATKWSDGEAWDQFSVGFYDREERGRHYVVNEKGEQFRANGFRRCEEITHDQGVYIIESAEELERTGMILWDIIHPSEPHQRTLQEQLAEQAAQKDVDIK